MLILTKFCIKALHGVFEKIPKVDFWIITEYYYKYNQICSIKIIKFIKKNLYTFIIIKNLKLILKFGKPSLLS